MEHQMTQNSDLKIICADDCKNAPKKILLKEFHIALAKNDIDLIPDNLTIDVYWNIIGEKLIQGKEDFTEYLYHMQKHKVIEIQMKNIITHGRTGAVNGLLRLENKKSFAFSNIFNFSNASKHSKIKEITSYVIEIF